MRKPWLVFCYTAAVVLLVSACGNAANSSENTEESAKEAGSKFVEKLYNVDDPDFYEKNFVSTDDDRNRAKAINELKEEFSPYLTETELKSLTDTGFLFRPLEAANNQENTITVEDLTFKKTDMDKVSKKVDFEHSFHLIFEDEEDEEVEDVKMKGQMTVVNTEDGWKIDRYYDDDLPIEMFNP